MIAVIGKYENGIVRLEKTIETKKPMNVIVTFLDETTQDENNQRLNKNDFSFSSAREASKSFEGSISESVVEERREGL